MDLDAISKRVKSARRGFGSSDDWRLNTIDALLSHVTDQAAQTATLTAERDAAREKAIDECAEFVHEKLNRHMSNWHAPLEDTLPRAIRTLKEKK
jgi:hypothetical protein